MKTREFDPAFSAALRDDLATLASAEARRQERRPGGGEAPRFRSHRSLVVLAVAAVLVAVTVGVLRLAPIPALHPAAPGPRPVDPLAQITDAHGDQYLRQTPVVLLRANGIGPTEWRISVPAGVTSVRPYVNCTPTSRFRIAVDAGGAATDCTRDGAAAFADIPVRAGEHRLTLRLPTRAGFALLLIATPVYSPSTPGPSRAPLPYPRVDDSSVLARQHGDSRIVSGRLEGTMRGVRIEVTCRGTGSVTVATSFGTLGSPADYDACGGTALQSGGALSGSDPLARPSYTITPYGDVSWTVTFLRERD